MRIATLDLGTTRVKGALWDLTQGKAISRAESLLSLDCRGPKIEQDLEDIERAWTAVLAQLVESAPASHWAALLIATQRGTQVLPGTMRLRSWLDRSVGQAQPSWSLLSWALQRLGGEAVDTLQTAPAIPLAPLVECGTIAGRWLRGPKLIAAGGDKNLELVGAGVVRPGPGVVSFGTALSLGVLIAGTHHPPGTFCLPAVIPGYQQAELGVPWGGAMWSWIRQVFGWEAEIVVPSKDTPIFIATLAGALDNTLATGLLHGLRPGTTAGEIAGAALEGLVCELLRSYSALPKPSELLLCGGAAAWGPFGGWLAQACGCPVYQLEEQDCGLRGLAMLGGVVLEGLSWEEAADRFSPQRLEQIEPSGSGFWNERLDRYNQVRDRHMGEP